MTTPAISRRDFVKNSAIAAATFQLSAGLAARAAAATAAAPAIPRPNPVAAGPVDLHWIDGGVPHALHLQVPHRKVPLQVLRLHTLH